MMCLMRMMRNRFDPRVAVACLLVALLLPVGGVGAEEHRLTLERDRAVGTQFKITVNGTQTHEQTQTLPGQAPQASKTVTKGSMSGVAEVLGVGKNKQVTSVAIKLDKFEGQAGNGEAELDLSKRIIITGNQGETKLTIEGGGPLKGPAAEVMQMLSAFMIEDQASDVSDDAMFKIDQPRKKGTSWACDNKLLAKEFSAGGELVVDPEAIESKFSFLDTAEFAGKPAAVFDVSVKVGAFIPKGIEQLGLEVKESGGTMNISGLMPLDPKSGDGAMQMQLEMSITLQGNFNGQPVKMASKSTVVADAEYRAID